MAVALITLIAPSANAAVTVSVGDSYSESFASQCGSSGTVKVWHPGGYDSGTGSVTVNGTFPSTHHTVTMTAISSGPDCTHAEMRYFTVHGSDARSTQSLESKDLGGYYGGRLDKPPTEHTATNGGKVVGYVFTNDLGNAVNEHTEGGVVVREVIEDSGGRRHLGEPTCIGVVVYKTGQVIARNTTDGTLRASIMTGRSGCLDEQQAAQVIATHQAAQAAFAAKWPSHYVASAWSYTRQ